MKLLSGNRCWLLVLLGLAFIPACSNDPSKPEEPVTVISDETVVIDEVSGISVASIDTRLIVFDASAGDPENLPFGERDILVGTENGGYLRRVASIEVAGDSVLVQTEDAVLAEVILEGGFSWSGPLEFDLVQSQQKGEVGYVHPAMLFRDERGSGDIFFTLDGLGISLGSDAHLEIENGSFCFAPHLDLDGHFDHGLQEFHAIISGDLDFDILVELALYATSGVHGQVELISDLPASTPIYIQAGWVPIVICPEFDLLLGAEASASGAVSLTGGVAADNSIEVGFRWTDTGGFETVYDKNLSGEVCSLEVSDQIGQECRVYLEPRLSFMVYTVAGPYVALEPYVGESGTVYLAPRSEYCTQWSLGIVGEVGANLEIFDWGFSASLDLVDWSIVLDEDCVEHPVACLKTRWLFEGTGADETGQHGCTLHGGAHYVPTPGGQGLFTDNASSYAEYAPPIDQIADGRIAFEFTVADTFAYSPGYNNPICIINSNRSGHLIGDFSVRLDPTDGKMWFSQEDAGGGVNLKTNKSAWEPVWYSVVIEWNASGRSIDVQWEGGSEYVSDTAAAPCFSCDATQCWIASRASDSPQIGLTIEMLEVWCQGSTPTIQTSLGRIKSCYL